MSVATDLDPLIVTALPGAGITKRRGSCPAHRRLPNPEACVPGDLNPHVSEAGVEPIAHPFALTTRFCLDVS
jgi:hypothetical protein